MALLNCQYVFVNLQLLSANKIPIIEYEYAFRDKLADRLIWNKIIPAPVMQENICNSQYEDVYCFSEKGNKKIGTIPFIKPLSNLISINSRQDKEFSETHKATFPIEFASHFVVNFAEAIVYDPFAGTGTTLIACEKFKKRCYSIELDPKYCDTIIQRWEDYTKQRAILCGRDGLLWNPDGSIWQRHRQDEIWW